MTQECTAACLTPPPPLISHRIRTFCKDGFKDNWGGTNRPPYPHPPSYAPDPIFPWQFKSRSLDIVNLVELITLVIEEPLLQKLLQTRKQFWALNIHYA